MADYKPGDVADATLVLPCGGLASVRVTMLDNGKWGIEVKPNELATLNGDPAYRTTGPGGS